ncbi:hypothetical protein R69608_05132 [Paraburkholderia nemoris]|uniref:hypothetical protein n=1 Tax=Paraburkholderia nemoris TaxID=2793076 RepID=UPI001911792C|nr:hypothetical protein [Paraburkholderia nemoris]MBK5149664.1 hypothetical protein [Burkholderia sp. R-69608]CAE6939049.1 hypothetical protein R69608_05132 [Paraburkholderia nemoris]
MSALQELFRRKREAQQLETGPKNVAAIAVANAEDDYRRAQLQKDTEAANAVKLQAPEILDGSKPLFFEIRPSRVGVVEVFYSRRPSFPQKVLGELKHEDLGSALIRLLANAQPDDIDIYRGSAEVDGDE